MTAAALMVTAETRGNAKQHKKGRYTVCNKVADNYIMVSHLTWQTQL